MHRVPVASGKHLIYHTARLLSQRERRRFSECQEEECAGSCFMEIVFYSEACLPQLMFWSGGGPVNEKQNQQILPSSCF